MMKSTTQQASPELTPSTSYQNLALDR